MSPTVAFPVQPKFNFALSQFPSWPVTLFWLVDYLYASSDLSNNLQATVSDGGSVAFLLPQPWNADTGDVLTAPKHSLKAWACITSSLGDTDINADPYSTLPLSSLDLIRATYIYFSDAVSALNYSLCFTFLPLFNRAQLSANSDLSISIGIFTNI